MKIQHKRIMIVGWFNPRYSAEGISQGFEQQGFEVIRVAADESEPKNSGKFDYHVIEELISVFGSGYKHLGDEIAAYQNGRRLFYLKWIVDKIDKPLDFILIIQFENPPDISGINIPVGYYYTETCDPSLPLGRNVDFVFYAFVGGLEKLSKIYPHWKQQWTTAKLIPHAINTDLIPSKVMPLKQRQTAIGFKGLLDFNTNDKNPLVKYIYAERKRFVGLLMSIDKEDPQNAMFVYKKNTNWNDYDEFMHETHMALNIPGIDGYINQRQYEALAYGCVLLQYKYDQLPELGFWGNPIKYPNKCNCLWFSNEQQLIDQINWVIQHPEESQIIADRGRKWLIESNQTWQGRAKEMLNALENEDEYTKQQIEKDKEMQHKINKMKIQKKVNIQLFKDGIISNDTLQYINNN